jgi:polysaccharide deacetylase family protein (PEP-CTERM system associated)
VIGHETHTRAHLLVVGVEDYFHARAFRNVIPPAHWYRFETRVEHNTLQVLDLLDRVGVKATVFVLDWVAHRHPDIVQEVVRRGHEIAHEGSLSRSVAAMTPGDFREELRRSREVVERAAGVRPIGYRAAGQPLSRRQRWVLDVLAGEGYAYDCSMAPRPWPFRDPWPDPGGADGRPATAVRALPLGEGAPAGWPTAVVTGSALRLCPRPLLERSLETRLRRNGRPLVLDVRVWEFDPRQPPIAAASWLTKAAHYRNLDRMASRFESCVSRYPFAGIAECLRLGAAEVAGRPRSAGPPATPTVLAASAPRGQEAPAASHPATRVPVTVVVPCFNEEQALPYLANTLSSVETRLARDYALRFIFVDDGSTDQTLPLLRELFGARDNCRIVRQDRNRGVAAAIRRGIREAATEIVCSMDCDCTYDPHDLGRMIPLLSDDAAVVTASPYHPSGRVRNVPPRRLVLSRTASRLYRLVLGQGLYTYTSCFRVYRRSAVVDLPLREDGPVGVAELLGRLDPRRARVIEWPATLDARVLGRSKLQLARAIVGHLRLLARLAAARLAGSPGAWSIPTLASRGGAASATVPDRERSDA